MAAMEADREFAELKYAQSLEGMRHVQKLEATEVGFVMVAYAVVIAGLLSAPAGALGRSGAWLLAILSVVVAGVLI